MESCITAKVANSNMYQINLTKRSNPKSVVPLRKELVGRSSSYDTTLMSSQQSS